MEPMKPMAPMKPMSPMRPIERWWPEHLGEPTSAGGQNDMRYAYFLGARLLVVQENGRTTTYDTADHHITGVAQQQRNSLGSCRFLSQLGIVSLDQLKVV